MLPRRRLALLGAALAALAPPCRPTAATPAPGGSGSGSIRALAVVSSSTASVTATAVDIDVGTGAVTKVGSGAQHTLGGGGFTAPACATMWGQADATWSVAVIPEVMGNASRQGIEQISARTGEHLRFEPLSPETAGLLANSATLGALSRDTVAGVMLSEDGVIELVVVDAARDAGSTGPPITADSDGVLGCISAVDATKGSFWIATDTMAGTTVTTFFTEFLAAPPPGGKQSVLDTIDSLAFAPLSIELDAKTGALFAIGRFHGANHLVETPYIVQIDVRTGVPMVLAAAVGGRASCQGHCGYAAYDSVVYAILGPDNHGEASDLHLYAFDARTGRHTRTPALGLEAAGITTDHPLIRPVFVPTAEAVTEPAASTQSNPKKGQEREKENGKAAGRPALSLSFAANVTTEFVVVDGSGGNGSFSSVGWSLIAVDQPSLQLAETLHETGKNIRNLFSYNGGYFLQLEPFFNEVVCYNMSLDLEPPETAAKAWKKAASAVLLGTHYEEAVAAGPAVVDGKAVLEWRYSVANSVPGPAGGTRKSAASETFFVDSAGGLLRFEANQSSVVDWGDGRSDTHFAVSQTVTFNDYASPPPESSFQPPPGVACITP